MEQATETEHLADLGDDRGERDPGAALAKILADELAHREAASTARDTATGPARPGISLRG